MAALWCRRPIHVPLLALLLLGASAAEPSPEHTVRAARKAMDRGEFPRAEAMLERAIAAHGAGESEAAWMLRVQYGEALTTQSKLEAAKAALSFTLPAQHRRSETAVQQLVQQAFVAFRSGDEKARAALIAEAERLAAAHRPPALADVYRAAAATDPPKAEQYARKSLAAARKHGRADVEAKALAALALDLGTRQRYAESVEVGEGALALATRLGLVYVLQNVEGNLGWSYFELGDYETAAEKWTAAEATAARMDVTYQRFVWLVNLGNIRMQQRDWAGAAQYNESALRVHPRHGKVAGALANLARIALLTGRLDDARRYSAESRKARAKDDGDGLRESDIVDARILATDPAQHARAEKLLVGAIDPKVRSTTRLEAQLRLAELYVRRRQHDKASALFQQAEVTAREARASITDRELRLSFFNTVTEMFDRYVDFLVSTNRVEEALAVTERSRAESLEEGGAAPAKLDARAVARKNNAVVLAYWLGRDRSYLWVVTANDIRLHPLPADTQIEKAAVRYRDDVRGSGGTLQISGARGEALYRMLVAPAGVPKESRVIVVADGELHTLNFETLVVPASTSRPRHYWIDDVVVMNAGSLQLLERSASKPAAAPSMLLVGNAPSPDPQFPSLAHAPREMSAIARRFDRRTVIDGPKATPAAYRAAAPEKFDYVHFVAHGVATRKRPLDSAVILASDESGSYKLLARDVIQKPLTAKLVTISSCDSAGTRTYAGEGVVGLAWAFQKAGADQVVAALWKVDDQATPALMDRMYAGIRAGQDPAAALRNAKLTLVRSTGLHRHPRFWAPFVLYAGT